MMRAAILSALMFTATAFPLAAQTVDTSVAAAEAKTPREVDVEADKMEILDEKKTVIFTGNVRGKRGDVSLTSDTLTVLYVETPVSGGENKTEVTQLDAKGKVKIVTPKQTVTGAWAKMDVKANKVTVGGDVKVVQGTSVISGAQLFVDLNKNISEMTGGRVKGSFVPAQ